MKFSPSPRRQTVCLSHGWRPVAAVLLCALLTPGPASLQAAAKKEKVKSGPGAALFRRAEKTFARRNYTDALALLDRAEAAGGAPRADVLNLRGAIYLRQKRYDEARQKFSAALSADPKFWVARYNLAETDLQEGRYGDSRRRLANLVGRAAKNGGPEARTFVQYKLLLADLLAGREEPVIRYLSEHRSTDAKRPDAGYCYLNAALADRRGQTAEAERWRARARRGKAPADLRHLFAQSVEKYGAQLASAGGGADGRNGANNPAPAARLTRTTPDSASDDDRRRAGEGREAKVGAGNNLTANERRRESTDTSASTASRSQGRAGDDENPSDVAAPASLAVVQLFPAPALARSSTRSGAPAAPHTLASKARPEPSPAAAANASEPPDAAAATPSIGDTLPSFRTSGSAVSNPTPQAAASPPAPAPKGSSSSPAATPASSRAPATAAAKPTSTPAATPEPPSEAFNAKYEAAFVAFSKRDYVTALKLLQEADTLQPGQADSANLRGLIYARQRLFAQAETEFKRAVQLDPTFWAAKFNLADLPFSYRNYGMARSRFEALLADIDPAQLPRETELTQFKIFLCLLLEGKEPSARAWMTRFKFEGATPARLYALAALDFHDGNFARAVSWMDSAKKQFPAQLEALFAESFYRIGWLSNNPTVAQNTPDAGAADNSGESPLPTPA
ncbi:MAG: tetratricopeptide repeat protein, partial [Verrucomicrobia bacterium]|nr:tetratricopeptide repeat protein [Verrucomicrobiota bacterium]